MRKQEQKGKITALYERLSHDDGRSDESVSVENQKRILEDYARKNGFTNVRHFTDDGVRGTTFKRPGLDAMVDEIRAGNVATVIVKDQSRIGRDVVEVGLLKRTFDEYNVRFIAANDNLDTANGFDIMSIFRDVINEWYVADTSRKIKTVFKSRMEKGLRCSGAVPYGYLASKEEKGEWVIDEEAAAVVRRIFQMVMDGQSVNGIARTLRAEQIPIPSEHWKRIGCPVRANSYRDPYAWSATTLGYILKRPEYLGRKVLGKTVCENYKTKSTRRTMPEEQFVFEGAVPAIIDEETWHNVQRLRETKRRTPKRSNAPNRLTGLLYCADCGAKLTHHNSLVQGKYIDDAFTCSRYRAPMEDCTIHYVATQKLEAAILSAIQRISWYVRNNEQEFVQRVRKASSLRQEEAVKDCRKQIVQAKKRHAELDGLVKKLYEANATGKLPDKHFSRLLAEYDEEQAALEASMTEWQGLLDNWNADRVRMTEFIDLAKRYTDFSELTTPILNEFIEKIVVHEGNGRGKQRRQRLERNRAYQQKQRDKKKASQPEKPRKRSLKELAKLDGADLTPEEAERLAAHRQKKAEQHKAWRDRQKSAQPPKPQQRTLKELARCAEAGLPLTLEEAERLEAHRNRKKAALQDLKARAETDPVAAAELAQQRAQQSEAVKKSRQKMYADAAAGDPEAQARYERMLAARRENYHRKKQAEAEAAQVS